MKKIVFLSLVCLLAVFAIVQTGQSKTKSYYSGDAVGFQDEVYVSTTNTNSLEVLKLENGELKLLAKVRPFDKRFNNYGNFYDAKLSVENGRLFVYAVDGFTLYKYELVSNSLKLVTSQKNTYWEWYNRIDKFGDNIVTISAKGVKIWNSALDVIDSYQLSSDTPYNLRSNGGQFILNVQDRELTVFDRDSRKQVTKVALDYKINPSIHKTYQDNSGNIYVVDDNYARKFSLSGTALDSFQHVDYEGYDVAASGQNDYIYFSNGLGVVKLNKKNMELVTSEETTNIGGERGWAMGLNVVSAGGSDKIIIFNNSNILILDENLKKLASFASTEEMEVSSTENLFLSLNRNFGGSGATITLNGGGYFPNEELSVDFAGAKSTVQTDARGRFTKELTVPATTTGPKAVDIKVDGQNSKLSYSTSFNIR